jgi:hypothetical protein
MSSHLYAAGGAIISAIISILCGYRVWQSLARGRAGIDINSVLTFFTGGDSQSPPKSGDLEFSRADFPRVFWVIVIGWGCLCALTAALLAGILSGGIH